MAKRRKSTKRNKPMQNPYQKCMSGTSKKADGTSQIHKERVKLMKELGTDKLAPKQAGLAMSRAAAVCKTT